MVAKTLNNNKKRSQDLAEENKILQETIKALQDQNGVLTMNNHDLDKRNAILEERLSSFGLRDFCKNAGWAGIGIAAGIGYTGKAVEGLTVAIGSSILVMIFSIYDNIWVKQKEKKEKVGI